MINPYHQVAVQNECGWAEHLGFLYRNPLLPVSEQHTHMGRGPAPYSETL